VPGKLSKPLKFALLVALFIGPALVFYLMIYGGYHKVKRLRFYGPHTWETYVIKGKTKIDTLYFTLPKFFGFDYLNHTYNSDSLEGKTYIAQILDGALFDSVPKEVVFSACELMDSYPNLFLLTIFIEKFPAKFKFPSRVTRRLEDDSIRWHFISVPRSYTDLIIKNGFFATSKDSLEFDPASFVLIDRDGHIRGYYNPILLQDIQNMKKEVVHLFREYELEFKAHKLVRFNH